MALQNDSEEISGTDKQCIENENHDQLMALYHTGTDVKRYLLQHYLSKTNQNITGYLSGKLECLQPDDIKRVTRRQNMQLSDLGVCSIDKLLTNHCYDLFWDCCLDKTSLENILDTHKKDLYSCYVKSSQDDNKSFKSFRNQKYLSKRQWKFLYHDSTCPNWTEIDEISSDLSTQFPNKSLTKDSFDNELSSIILSTICPLYKSVQAVTENQMTFSRIAVGNEINNADFDKIWNLMEANLKPMSNHCGCAGYLMLEMEKIKESTFDREKTQETRKNILESTFYNTEFLKDVDFLYCVQNEIKRIEEEETRDITKRFLERQIRVSHTNGQYRPGSFQIAITEALRNDSEVVKSVCSRQNVDEEPLSNPEKIDVEGNQRSIDTINYMKLVRLILVVAKDVLVDVLIGRLHGADYGNALKGMKGRLSPFLNVAQRQKIFPEASKYTGNLSDMDISLLYIILRNLNTIASHQNGWGNDPEENDRTPSANIDRIRIAKNTIVSHSSSFYIGYAYFNNNWKAMRQCCVELGGEKYGVTIDILLTSSIDCDSEQQIAELVKNLKENDLQFERRLNKIEECCTSVELKIEGNNLPCKTEVETQLDQYNNKDISQTSVKDGSIIICLEMFSSAFQNFGYFLAVIDGVLQRIFQARSAAEDVIDDVIEISVQLCKTIEEYKRNTLDLEVKHIHREKTTENTLPYNRICKDDFNRKIPSGTSAISSSSGSLMTNYARIGHAAQQIFPDILQGIVAIKEPQHRLYSDVTSNRYLTRNLQADEWSMINNVRTIGYVNFDIPLIYKLVSNLNLVPPPSNGWDFHIPPTATEILPGDDIERIRRTRNDILHRGNAQVSDSILTDYFTNFKEIAVRMEAFLGKPKGEFVQKFLFLEKCCMDEETEKTYLEHLTILREHDINPSKAVANIQKDLNTLIYKESHQILIEEWEEKNKLFIKSDAVDFVLKSLKDNNCCTVIGTAGIGKSATIHHVALFLRDTEGYRIIPIHSPSDIEKYFQRNRKQIFVIDDICGKYTVIQTEVAKWIKRNNSMNRLLKYTSTKVIASCRIQVFNENQFKRLKLFTENFCNLSSHIFHLSSQVKLQIARQYLPERAVEHIKNDLDKYEFLPLMFALYKSLNKENENIDVVQFKKKPFNIYSEEIDVLHLLLDKTKFCALFFLVIYNGSLNVSFFTNCENEQERQKREDVFEDCGIPRNTLRQRILEQLESLVPLFVRTNYDLSGQVISFAAIHDKLFDFLSFYCGNKFQKSFLRFADSEMLYERTMLKSLVSTDEDVGEFTILIDDYNEDRYFKRIVDQWSSGKLASLFYSRQMNYETYRIKLINFLNRLPKEKCEEMMTIKIDKGVVQFNFIDDSCTGSLPVSPLSLSFKRNFYDLVKYILDFINDTKGESFSLLLMKACCLGLTDVVRILIDKGSNIDFRDTNGWTPSMAACEHGHKSIVELLLKSGANVRQADNYGWTPFMRACGKGHADVVKFLIKSGIKIDQKDKYGQTPLMLAMENGHLNTIELLLDNITKHELDNKVRSPLIFACDNGWTNIVKLLINRGADVNIFDIYGMTPLLAAFKGGFKKIGLILLAAGAIVYDNCGDIFIWKKWSLHDGNEDVVKTLTHCRDESEGSKCGRVPLIGATIDKRDTFVKLLIGQGKSVNASDKDGMTPLSWACKLGHFEIIKVLISEKANLNASNVLRKTPLIYACQNDHNDIVQLLIEKEADVNLFDEEGDSPLHFASKNDNSDIVRLLIENGADVNPSNISGQTPLMWSCRNDNSDIVELLIEKGADVNVADNSGETPLIMSCENDYSNIVRLLIEKEADVNKSDNFRKTPLMWSCKNNNSDIVILLLEKGADINVSDNYGATSLMWSCKCNNSEIIRLLIEKEADINVSDSYGATPLTLSCKRNNSEIVRLLIEKEADVNVSDEYGQTPLIWSCENNQCDIVRLLIEKGADVNISDNFGKNPLIWSCKNNNHEIVRLLIEKGADVNVSEEFGRLPLIWSWNDNEIDIVKLLMKKGADVNVPDKRGKTPLIWSCENDCSNIVRLLIERGADVNVSDVDGQTPLIWSCKNNNSDIVRLLIEKGADVNVSSVFGETPLILSCENNNSDIVRLLIVKEADVNVSNVLGETPLVLSCENNNSDIVRLLIKKGANVNVSDLNGDTPLMGACTHGYYDMVRLLILKGAAVNVRGYNGMTALNYASKHLFIEIVKELILNGADLFLADKNGKTPLIYANENEDRRIENFFSKYLYKLHIFDRKRKISKNGTDIEVTYDKKRRF